MKLYYSNVSSAACRVAIAIDLKRIAVQKVPVGIIGADAENRRPEYLLVNPQGLVPVLSTDEGVLISQSLAIVEYLEERFPTPALLPNNIETKARARSIALAIASEIHALIPPRVVRRLMTISGFDGNAVADWRRHWVKEGLSAVETLIAGRRTGAFAVGDAASVADIFLFPQAIAAERSGLDLDQWPNIAEIMSHLHKMPAFAENIPVQVK